MTWKQEIESEPDWEHVTKEAIRIDANVLQFGGFF